MPSGSDGKESAFNVRDLSSLPGLGKFHGEGNGYPLQYSCLENSITLYAKQKKRHRCIEQTLDSVGEGKGGMFRENSIKTCILSRVKQIISPGWMHETSAWTWCTGKTQRDRVEREVREGIGMENTCISKADSCQCMTKTTTIL